MKNLAGLPERWAVNIVEEAEYQRMGEFKDWWSKNMNPNNRFIFNYEYKGYNIDIRTWDNEALNHCNDDLPEGVTLITLDRFFEALEGAQQKAGNDMDSLKELLDRYFEYLRNWPNEINAILENMRTAPLPVITDAGKEANIARELVAKGEGQCTFITNTTSNYSIIDGVKYVKRHSWFVPHFENKEAMETYLKLVTEQPTQLKIEDAKKAYIKALGLEGKKIDWV